MIFCAMSRLGNFSFNNSKSQILINQIDQINIFRYDSVSNAVRVFVYFALSDDIFSFSIPLSLFFSLNMKDLEPSACPETTSYAHEMEQVTMKKDSYLM